MSIQKASDFNKTLQNLLKTLPEDQKPCLSHLGALVFAYNTMLHSTTGYKHTNECLVVRLKHLSITGGACLSIIVVSPPQMIHGLMNNMNGMNTNKYGLQTSGY